jgi:hypothetical protein
VIVAQYRTAIVSFIDILGFRDIIAKRTSAEIQSILKRLITTAQPFSNIAEDKIVYVNFSDNLVRVSWLPDDPTYEDVIDSLYVEISDLGGAQALLTQRGVFIRGGISVGEIFLQDGLTFGPGLVRAYETESRLAQAPRIVIDPESISRFSIDTQIVDVDFDEGLPAEFECRGYLARDTDRSVFIDYLRGVIGEGDDPTGTASIKLFENHRDQIVNAFSQIPRDAWLKYFWLRDYHNRSVDLLSDAILHHNGRERAELECHWPDPPERPWREGT